eukprot:CAMPEP_0181309846 /NCGR_PEP_ID=MMETSP1101-20121128/12244_1 /TAXON_ID=46948 /ORGANISM="Rhodomonas abbreviata, Strain Caron Lab Isolate" /LENGTH=225 /DNA_ID=CAMNT_0023416383 /DNA_START=463 /DNA_END=1137 /DNA_ORIENTATION=-
MTSSTTKEMNEELLVAIQSGDPAVLKQLASALTQKSANRLVEELSEQKKLNVHKSQAPLSVQDFRAMDANKDGVITAKEFETFLKECEAAKVTEPTRQQLWMIAIASAVPFVGFGFMDNAIMILAGEVIEAKLGVAFGITTMAAAAIGNLISDVCGVGLGGTVEVIAVRMGFQQPNLSAEQMHMKATRLMSNLGAAVGVSFGCFLGMFPLLFITHPPKKDPDDSP